MHRPNGSSRNSVQQRRPAFSSKKAEDARQTSLSRLAAGVNATAFGGHSPGVDPSASSARAHAQGAVSSSGMKIERKVLTGPAPS